MISHARRFALVPILLLSGCVAAPTRQDPFASLNGGIFRDVSVALVLSPNTVEAGKYLESVAGNVMGMGGNKGDIATMMPNVLTFIQSQFKSASRAMNIEEAQRMPVDAVLLLDVYVKIGSISGTLTTADYKLMLIGKDGQPIETYEGHGRRRVPYPNFTLRAAEVGAAALDQLTAGVRGSARLQELQKQRAAAPSAAPAVAARAPVVPAAPAEPVYTSDVDAPSYKESERPDNFALVIGVEKYESLPKAAFAKRDAAAVRAHLLAMGYPERNIVFLTDEKAGRASIEKYVESWLPRNVKKDSKVLVYFSGHGAPDPEKGKAYLVPWDGDPKFLENTGYPIERLYAKLNALPADNVLVAMDACFSGTGGRSVLAAGLRPLVSKLDMGASSVGRLAVLSASGADEVTGAEETQGHGLFTYYMLKGLNAKGGSATAGELHGYLLPKVQDRARRDNRDQTPQLVGAARRSFN